jgi:alpha-L-fucosidase
LISVLGHSGKVLEYNPETDPSPSIINKGDGVEISVMRAQRIYNDRKWPNPIVVKIEEIEFLNDSN